LQHTAPASPKFVVLLVGWIVATVLVSGISEAKAQAFSEPQAPLSLRSAIEYSLAHNPDIALARQEIAASEGAVIQGRVRPNPELGFVQENLRYPSRSNALQLNFPIELGGKRAARIDASERGRDIATSELAQRQGEVRAITISAYFDVLASQERVLLAESTLELAKRNTDAASKRVQAGRISPVEETKAKVAEANVRVELSQAQSDLRGARQRLTSLWGTITPRFEKASEPVEKLPEAPSTAALEARYFSSPFVQRAEFEAERRQAIRKLEQAKRIPDPTFSIGMKQVPNESSQVLAGVSIALPIFDTNQGNVIEAQRREEKARSEVLSIRFRLQTDVLQVRERLLAGRSEVQALADEVVPGAQSAFEAARIGFEAGKFSFLEVLDAQRTLILAKTQKLKALEQTHRAAAEIDRLLGDLPATNN
jgi:outer membrane protein, heavy metal efflux system